LFCFVLAENKGNYRIDVNVQDFRPEEVTVKVTGGKVLVHAKRESKNEDNDMYAYTFRYLICPIVTMTWFITFLVLPEMISFAKSLKCWFSSFVVHCPILLQARHLYRIHSIALQLKSISRSNHSWNTELSTGVHRQEHYCSGYILTCVAYMYCSMMFILCCAIVNEH